MDGFDLLRCTLQPRATGLNDPHRHPWHEVHLVMQGSGIFGSGSRRLDLHHQPTLADIARAGRVSPAYASRLGRRHLGQLPLAWHRNRWLAGSDLAV